jgi:hypothetical protein
MKKMISILSIATIVCITLSFTYNNSASKSSSSSEELCYEFYVKCKGSNQFVETVKAKSQSVAKTMVTNRYSECSVQTKSPNGHKCN